MADRGGDFGAGHGRRTPLKEGGTAFRRIFPFSYIAGPCHTAHGNDLAGLFESSISNQPQPRQGVKFSNANYLKLLSFLRTLHCRCG
ncbi:MAG TPA: hypothetical protein VJQ77_09855 [Novosphingobium sp.]|nr:hypothetical protein [Novosphingobium sp.]